MALQMFLGLTAICLVFFGFSKKISKGKSLAQGKETNLWNYVAKCFYSDSVESRTLPVEILLGAIAEYLQASTAIVLIRKNEENSVLYSWSRDDYWKVFLKTGMKITPYLTYCESLGKDRGVLTIPFASMSEWRKHPAYQNQRIESYIGSFRALDAKTGLSICFFSQSGKENLYNDSHRVLLTDLCGWVAARYQSLEDAKVQRRAVLRGELNA